MLVPSTVAPNPNALPVPRLFLGLASEHALRQLGTLSGGSPCCSHDARAWRSTPAIFGAYDDPKPILRQSVPTDFYLFSDRQTERAPGWRVEVIAPPAPPHPRMQAKWFRMHPHKLFPSGRARPRRRLHRYDFTIWLDASMTITSANFAREAIAAAAGHELACFGHPWRDCIFEEAKASIAMPHKYGSQDIAAQARAYREQGHPEHGGLFATGLLVRSTLGDAPARA